MFSFAVFSFWLLEMHKYFGLIKPWIFSKKFAVTVSKCLQNTRHFTTENPFTKRSIPKNETAANMTVNMQAEMLFFEFPFSQDFVSH